MIFLIRVALHVIYFFYSINVMFYFLINIKYLNLHLSLDFSSFVFRCD
jgi:hypothetical protein